MKQTIPSSSSEKLARLRQELGSRLMGINGPTGRTVPFSPAGSCLPLGLPLIDAHLGGGLTRGALHEIAGSDSDTELATQPAFFASQLLLQHPDLRAMWIATNADLYGSGLLALGLDPARLLLVESRQDAESLWALEEAARSGAVSLVIGEIDFLDLTASRRLQLAAEEKTCTILLLRRSRLMNKGKMGNGAKHRQPSAAVTRWQITPLPSRLIEDENHSGLARPGLGMPCWHLHLWRQRNGSPAAWNITLQGQHWQQMTPAPQRQSIMAANDDSKFFTTEQYDTSAG